MRKNLNQDHSYLSFESEPHPGCMWGILHIFNFHQWHTVKKMLPYRRHNGGRHAEGTQNMETEMDVPDTGEAQELRQSEVDDSLSEEKMSEMSPTQKKSGKARMKKLIAEAMSKQAVHKSRLLRIDSIHHIGPSHQDLPDEVRIDVENPTIVLNQDDANTPSSSTWNSVHLNLPFHKHCEVCRSIGTLKSLGPDQLDELKRLLTENHIDKANESLLKQKASSDMELHRDVALYQSKEFLEALEIFSVKKALFLKILEDPDYALAHHFQGLWASNAKRGLTRSGTFPVANPTEENTMKRIKLKNKQKEKTQLQEKLGTDNPPSTLTTNEYSEDDDAKSIPLLANNNADSVDQGSPIVGETNANVDSCPVPSHELKKRGHRFKDIKQKIKHAIKESRKEGHRVSMDAILHKIPYGRRFSKSTKKEMTQQWKESAMDRDSKDSPKSSNECSSSASTPGKVGFHRMRRTASLSESLDRYAQLFEFSFNRESKQPVSDRLKLTNEDGSSTVGCAPKSLGRILSLPDLECYCSLQCEVTPDVLCSGKPTGLLVKTNRDNESLTYTEQNSLGKPISKEDSIQLGVFSESRNQENLVEVDESSPFGRDQIGLALDTNGDDIAEVGENGTNEKLDAEMGEFSSISQYEQETGLANNTSCKLAQPSPVSVFDFSRQEGVGSHAKFFISEDHELKPRFIQFDEAESSCQGKDQSGLDYPSVAGRTTVLENVKIQSKDFDSEYLQIQVDRKDDFNYVRDVLKLSGFTGNKYLETWHSPDQPLDPCLFEEMECLPPYKPECSEGETSNSYYDHQRLFDTINEVLLEIYHRSFTYWPRPLSCNTSIRPMPIRHHVLEEVWASISWYLSSQPEEDPSLDYAVARDLSKVDGWLNLQMDSECVGLELEDLILNDLLEEVIYS